MGTIQMGMCQIEIYYYSQFIWKYSITKAFTTRNQPEARLHLYIDGTTRRYVLMSPHIIWLYVYINKLYGEPWEHIRTAGKCQLWTNCWMSWRSIEHATESQIPVATHCSGLRANHSAMTHPSQRIDTSWISPHGGHNSELIQGNYDTPLDWLHLKLAYRY